MSEQFRRETFGEIEVLARELLEAHQNLNQYCERYRELKDYLLTGGEAIDRFERRSIEGQQVHIEADIKDVIDWILVKNEKLKVAINNERGNPVFIDMGAKLPPFPK